MIHPFQVKKGMMMRGTDEASGALFSYVDLDERVPVNHPLRLIRRIVNDALTSLDADFDALYTKEGRPSIAPERLIRASLLQMLFSIRSERQLMEQMDYNLPFRWFVGLGVDDPVWVPTVFTKNRALVWRFRTAISWVWARLRERVWSLINPARATCKSLKKRASMEPGACGARSNAAPVRASICASTASVLALVPCA